MTRVPVLLTVLASALAAPAAAQDEPMRVERITPAMIEAAEYAYPAKTVECFKDALKELGEREDGWQFLVSEQAARGQIWLAHPDPKDDPRDLIICTPRGRANTPQAMFEAIMPPGFVPPGLF